MFNKLNKMVMSLLLTAMFCLAITSFGINSASAETGNEVKLLHADIQYGSAGVYFFKGSIEVENIAYHKVVNVVTRTGPNDPWVKIPATYVAPTEGNFEAWEWNVFPGYGVWGVQDYKQFYIEYIVDGNRYVDDNNGTYYAVGELQYNAKGFASTILNKPAVKVNYYCNYCGPHSTGVGYVTLKNIAYHKDVKLVYTTDNWATVQVQNLKYYGPMPNTNDTLEQWWFYKPYDKMEFAIMYTVEGITYWDTNFGRNYR